MWSMSKWAEGKEKTDDELPILIFKLANAFFFFFYYSTPSPVTVFICRYVKE